MRTPVSLALIVFVLLVVGYWLLPRNAAVGVVENSSGIPFPAAGEPLAILEPLAHTDVQVQQNLARQLTLRFSFIPHEVSQLSVGIRENPFWLSYPRHIFYEASSEGLPVTTARQVSVTLPLTDKLLEVNGTVDVMFFAGTEDAIALAESTPHTRVHWELADLQAKTTFAWPTSVESKDYVRALLTHEKPQ